MNPVWLNHSPPPTPKYTLIEKVPNNRAVFYAKIGNILGTNRIVTLRSESRRLLRTNHSCLHSLMFIIVLSSLSSLLLFTCWKGFQKKHHKAHNVKNCIFASKLWLQYFHKNLHRPFPKWVSVMFEEQLC